MASEDWTYTSNCEVPSGCTLPEGTQRYAVGIEYDGSRYSGWQYQDHSPSVQAVVEAALSRVAASNIRVSCAGRTDTGVHATGQVIHFDSSATRTPRQWRLGANANLPDSVVVTWVAPVLPSFHARFSATSRRYLYLITNSAERPAILARQVSWCRHELNLERMRECLDLFVGQKDFSAFRASQCQARSPLRTVHHARVLDRGEWLALDICANGFLHHMVRNIVGALLAVGRGELDRDSLEKIFATGDRQLAPATASPNGLYLVDISYPPEFELPQSPAWPLQLMTAD